MRNDRGDRSLRQLAGYRPTQLSPTDAMRAREVGRPTGEDLAAAADDLVLVRRHYVPPEAPGATSGGAAPQPRRPARDTRQDGDTKSAGSAS